MNQHYSEADLLETYYAQPGASMPVMMHLADCGECATRYERLEKKVRALSACAHDDKPETFWARQRISVMRKIDARRERTHSMARMMRMAAAVVFAVALGVFVTWRVVKPVAESPSRQVATTQTAQLTPPPLDDSAARSLEDSPWQSDELSEYQSMVAWESWVDNGDKSL